MRIPHRLHFALPSALRANCIIALCNLSGRKAWITRSCWNRLIFFATEEGNSCSHLELCWNADHCSRLVRSSKLNKLPKTFCKEKTKILKNYTITNETWKLIKFTREKETQLRIINQFRWFYLKAKLWETIWIGN